MPLPESASGTVLPAVTVDVERGRLRFFAGVIGETDPVYSSVDAARSAGHRDLPVPPTFLFGLELEQPEPLGYLTDLGVDLRHVLHGEQTFVYHCVAYAGDRLTLSPRIAEVYRKKGLDFVVKQTAVARADGVRVADLTSVVVVRDPAGAR